MSVDKKFKKLDDIDHVILRPGMYIGKLGDGAAADDGIYILVKEVVDNCIDEFYRGHVTEIHTTLDADGKTVTVTDNGIGFPVEKIKDVYTEFRTGSKFKDEEVDENSDTKYYSRIQGSGQQGSSLNTDTNHTHPTNPSNP